MRTAVAILPVVVVSALEDARQEQHRREGTLFALAVASSPVKGAPPPETTESIRRFADPIAAALRASKP